jgi:hypothetical protein
MHYVIGLDTIEALRWAEGLPNSDGTVYAKQAAFISFLLNVAFIAVHAPRLKPTTAAMPCRHPAFHHGASLAQHVPVKSDIVAAALAYNPQKPVRHQDCMLTKLLDGSVCRLSRECCLLLTLVDGQTPPRASP